jgi:pimeloyl-ACP methyl ester carboxylesterase
MIAKLILEDNKFITYKKVDKQKKEMPSLVYVSGFGSDLTSNKAIEVENFATQKGLGYLGFEYFGHGSSYGNFTDYCLSDWIENAITSIDKLIDGPLILVGSSMGGFVMLHMALKRLGRVVGMLAIAPAPDMTHSLMLPSFSAEHLKMLEEKGVIEDIHPSGHKYVITKKLIDDGAKHLLLHQDEIKLDLPIRIIHGMQDQDVPYQLSINLANKLTSQDVQITLVKDGEHRLSRENDLKLIINKIEELLAIY